MKAFAIKDLAEVLIEELGDGEIELETIGLRPGERLDEMLMTEEEAAIAVDDNGMYIIRPEIEVPHYIRKGEQGKGARLESYHSKHAPLLTKAEIKKLLKDENII